VFERVGNRCWSGREIKKWLDRDGGLRTRTGKKVSLSSVYMILGNPFYTGRYEFPIKSGKWYKGKHDPIIPQELFDKVQENLTLVPKGDRGAPKEFTYTRLFSCGACGAGITAEEKVKRLVDGTVKRYVYYHCTRKFDDACRETFLREEALVEQLSRIVDGLDLDELGTAELVRDEMEKYRRLLAVVSKMDPNQKAPALLPKIDVRACAKVILQDGSKDEKRKLLEQLRSRIILKGGKLIIEKARKS
jgi:hypothetical protein